MTIRALRILPPLALARLGGADEPQVNYTLADHPEHPLEFRRIVARETLEVDEASGAIRRSYMPDRVDFRAGPHIRPGAPFLEVFAETDEETLEPLTIDLLRRHGLTPSSVAWRATVANLKVVRRTNDEGNAVSAETPWFNDHVPQALHGHCPNFLAPEQCIEFGHVRYIRPTEDFPGIRLRFTPARGLIYGPAEVPGDPDSPGIVAPIPPERRIYDPTRSWYKFMVPLGIDDADPDYTGPFVNETLPASLFAIVPPAPPWLYGNKAVSRGYLDDACDGVVEVALTLGDGTRLQAAARVASGPPIVVPDALFVRTLADDLDQALLGPAIAADEPDDVVRARAEDIIRRAYETVRFLNVAFMNGNSVKGRPPLDFDTMPAEEAFDTDRLERPVWREATVDTLAVMALHQQVFAALRGGAAPWFVRLLRQPDQAADYTDAGRRKMPAMMCGGDNNYLALTHRQIDTIRAVSERAGFAAGYDDGGGRQPAPTPSHPAASVPSLAPRNLTAQLHYVAAGNPHSTRLENSVANCTPGLEVDMRAVWRRLFQGIVLREYDNLVVTLEPPFDDPGKAQLAGHRLLRVAGIPVVTTMLGPSPADPDEAVVLATDGNPSATAPMEWSNSLAHVLHQYQGQRVKCDFSRDVSWLAQVALPDDDKDYLTFEFTVRHFFEEGTAVISRTLAQPGELTQGLCSPWQNDYRECSCYYWASARPDYVNVEPAPNGASRGDNWLQKVRTGDYVPDDYADGRLILYDELLSDWEEWLRFQVNGRDMPGDGVASA